MTRAQTTHRREKKTTPRFRINPIELGIFSTVVLVFLNSAYHLVEEGSELSLAALSPAHERPSIQSRGPAGLRSKGGKTLADTQIQCGKMPQQTTEASKMRLTGEICLPTPPIGPAMPRYRDRPESSPIFKEGEIRVSQNGHAAHLFIDPDTGKYVTDYIPLVEGLNDIQISFTFQPTEGKRLVETQSVRVFRSLAGR